MKTFIFSGVGLLIGGAAGYFIGSTLAKKKYLKIADTEVKSVKDSLEKYYNEKIESLKVSEKNVDEATTTGKPKKAPAKKVKVDIPLIDTDSIDRNAMKDINNEEKAYKKYVKNYKPQETEKEEKPEEGNLLKPYVISPDEFADSEYDVKTLNWYADGVLADDEYNVIKDIKGYVGDDALNSFGLYELDTVYVRNEKYKIDYEILLDERNYKDVAPKGVTTIFPGDDE